MPFNLCACIISNSRRRQAFSSASSIPWIEAKSCLFLWFSFFKTHLSSYRSRHRFLYSRLNTRLQRFRNCLVLNMISLLNNQQEKRKNRINFYFEISANEVQEKLISITMSDVLALDHKNHEFGNINAMIAAAFERLHYLQDI